MNTSPSLDPFQALGVPRDASEAEIRARYLELVRQFPPERDPDKFRELRTAYEAAKDPLLIAQRLIEPPGDEVPRWVDAIEEQKQIPPVLTPTFLLSLGNRERPYRTRTDAFEPSDIVPNAPIGEAQQNQRGFEQPND